MRGSALALVLFTAVDAHADPDDAQFDDDAEREPDEVRISLVAERGRFVVELYDLRARVHRDAPLARCTTPCTAQVVPGKYRLSIDATDHSAGGSRVIVLARASHVAIGPPSEAQRTIGLALGIVGIATFVTGTVMFYSSVCLEQCRSDRQDLVLPGLVLMLTGIVATPIGWVMYGTSFGPHVTVTSREDHALAPPGGPVPIGIGFRGAF